MTKIFLYTDGACWGNPGVGGWAYVIKTKNVHENLLKEENGAVAYTTNNKMELTAFIRGIENVNLLLSNLDFNPSFLEIYSDSQYVIKGATLWRKNWKKKNYINVKNTELWMKVDDLLDNFSLAYSIHWVKGHSGHEENERCDKLATMAIEEFLDLQKKRSM